jgi:hypothetical protein
VTLGVACGIWINSRMASSADAARRAAPSRVPSDARAETPPLPSVAPSVETRTLQNTAEAAQAAPLRVKPAATVVEARSLNPAAPAATPAAGEPTPEPTPEPKPRARLLSSFVSRESSEPEEKEQGQPSAPCALYASASSLAVRGGGAASLVVGGPGETGPVTVTTQSRADIAVVREGRAANGWVRYSVKSISNRPGLYNVRFATSCGSQTIPVTVK